MHGIASIVTHLATASGTAANAPSGQSGSGFQIAMSARSSAQPQMQGVSAGVSHSLGSQTASLLLQTQDLNQTQAHGHGGGGGHHGGMKATPGLETEEAGESEGAQHMRKRKKLTTTAKLSEASGTVEVDENGIVVKSDIDQSDADFTQKDSGKSL